MSRRTPALTVYDPHGLGMAGVASVVDAHQARCPVETTPAGQAGLAVWEVLGMPGHRILAYYTPAGTLVLWVQP
jgi:hypothetical protein